MADTPLYNEKELLQQVARGNEEAFAAIFHAWRDKLYFFILRISNSPATAEDVVQDVFVKLWLNRHRLADVEHFSGWLYKIAQNRTLTELRKMALETTILSELRRKAITSDPSPNDAMLLKHLRETLHQAVDRLPPQQKLVYTLCRIDGLKHEDIARRLNLSISTVKNHMTEALRNIRRHIGENYTITAFYCLLFLTSVIHD